MDFDSNARLDDIGEYFRENYSNQLIYMCVLEIVGSVSEILNIS